MNDGRVAAAVAVNILLMLAQIIGRVVSGSLSLIADALHNLNDAASLALFARTPTRALIRAELATVFSIAHATLEPCLGSAMSSDPASVAAHSGHSSEHKT